MHGSPTSTSVAVYGCNFPLSEREINELHDSYKSQSPYDVTITKDIKLFANDASITSIWPRAKDQLTPEDKQWLQGDMDNKDKPHLLSWSYMARGLPSILPLPLSTESDRDLQILTNYIGLAKANRLPPIKITFTKRSRDIKNLNLTAVVGLRDETWFLVTFGFKYTDNTGQEQTVSNCTFNQVRDKYLKYLAEYKPTV